MYCVPGDRLNIADDKNIGGKGTFTKGSYIYSSLAGEVKITETRDEKIIEVENSSDISKRVPSVGDIVTCKVERITLNQCKCAIQCIGNHVLKQSFRAIARKEDIRENDRDNVDIYKCFRPGDIILSTVIGLSDYGYLLSTASEDLGVVIARSEFGALMIPHSWTEMICPRTKVIESRKVAKIVLEKNEQTDKSESSK
ncbi:exosome component 1 Csl4 [Brevipalpus obovatus]|uniref:exosome component 1 Csl4 n=1 Tax=Brevipalpus obovatus TaxID=246614 RepID=UPI003D9DD93D